MVLNNFKLALNSVMAGQEGNSTVFFQTVHSVTCELFSQFLMCNFILTSISPTPLPFLGIWLQRDLYLNLVWEKLYSLELPGGGTRLKTTLDTGHMYKIIVMGIFPSCVNMHEFVCMNWVSNISLSCIFRGLENPENTMQCNICLKNWDHNKTWDLGLWRSSQ